ncbi:acyl-CoA thioesterase [Actinacidiphila guanduensis]|uniref:Acyl-CoA thioester hydrolase n=1 Tax=Actinacidiphila guanduensis TaxID=310781 RepID=A0A1H0S394_9ACTN|nr:acyl-CoA thioesterase [Actinacidiphila guanduensis]SDP36223.1 acyl-CoA thioester hydrolase [Actinacidiphila guanduensis]
MPSATLPSEPQSGNVGIFIPVEIFFDDLDAMGLLYNGRFQTLVERAWFTFWRDRGIGGRTGLEGDSFNVIKAFTITYETPVTLVGTYAVHLWIDRLGTTSATAGFRFCSLDGATTYAHGTRAIVCLDRTTLTPTPWSSDARRIAETIMRQGH